MGAFFIHPLSCCCDGCAGTAEAEFSFPAAGDAYEEACASLEAALEIASEDTVGPDGMPGAALELFIKSVLLQAAEEKSTVAHMTIGKALPVFI